MDIKKILFGILITLSHLAGAQGYYACSCLLPEKYAPAVANRETVSLLNYPSGNLVKTLHFGQEQLMNLEEPTAVGGVIYKKIRTSNGEEGWVRAKEITLCGQGRVIAQRLRAYKDSLMSGKGSEFFAGEPVLITENFNGLFLAESKDKKRKGWISDVFLIAGEKEVKTAIVLEKINNEPKYDKKIKALEMLKKESEGSALSSLIHEQYHFLELLPPSTQYASRSTENNVTVVAKTTETPRTSSQTTNYAQKPFIRERKLNNKEETSNPKTENALQKPLLKATPASKALPIPEKNIAIHTNVQREKVVTANPYWKNTESLALVLMEVYDEELTCYHPTLPLNSKVYIPLPDKGGVIALNVIGKSKDEKKIYLPKLVAERIYGTNKPQIIDIIYYTR